MTYFLFTSLSTVGLGDFTPRSDKERLVGAFVLLFGVAITSFLMESLSNLVAAFKEFNDDVDHHEQLSLFFGTIERFNGNQRMPEELHREIEDYFEYRWSQNKNNAIETEGDLDMLL